MKNKKSLEGRADKRWANIFQSLKVEVNPWECLVSQEKWNIKEEEDEINEKTEMSSRGLTRWQGPGSIAKGEAISIVVSREYWDFSGVLYIDMHSIHLHLYPYTYTDKFSEPTTLTSLLQQT